MTELEINLIHILGDWIESKRAWSMETFGNAQRSEGIVKHIQNELIEVLDNPKDVSEWIDVILLALDGARRAGFVGEDIAYALFEKQHKNEKRKWGDHLAPNEAGHHVKE